MMELTIEVTPDVETWLKAESAKKGLTAEQLAVNLLTEQREVARRKAAIALIDSWLAEAAANPERAKEDRRAMIEGMNANRAGGRIPFPPELEGVSW